MTASPERDQPEAAKFELEEPIPGGRSSRTAGAILREAARLFATQGYDATSMSQIAEAAGIAKPLIYHHFQNKEGLAKALLLEPLFRLQDAMRELVERKDLDPVSRIVLLVRLHLEFGLSDPNRTRFAYAQLFAPVNNSVLHQKIGHACCQFAELMRSACDELAKAGIMPESKVDAFLANLRGQITIRMLDSLYRGEELDPESSAELVADLIWGVGNPRFRRKYLGASTVRARGNPAGESSN